MKRPPDPSPEAGRDPLAYHDERFLESDDGRPLRILSEYLRPLSVFRRRRIHDTIVFFGSARIGEDGAARRVLRGGPRARAPGHRVVGGAREPGASLPRLHRRRPRDHGGGQPRRAGGRRPHDRPQHRPAARAAAEPLHHPRTLVRVPLLLHAQAVVRLPRARHHRVPRRLRHPGRAVRVPDPVADRQDRPAGGHAALRHAVLERDRGLRRLGAPRHGQRRRPQAAALRRHAGRRRSPCSASACGRRTRPSPGRRSPGRSRLGTSARPAAPRRRSTR